MYDVYKIILILSFFFIILFAGILFSTKDMCMYKSRYKKIKMSLTLKNFQVVFMAPFYVTNSRSIIALSRLLFSVIDILLLNVTILTNNIANQCRSADIKWSITII